MLGLVIGLTLFGCAPGPSAVHVPSVDPAAASEQALALYDADKNGELSKAELAACPGVLGHFAAYDADGSGAVSPAEFEQQVHDLTSGLVGVTSLRIQVRYNGRPLPDATVKLVPEPYLGDEIAIAHGKTNPQGIAAMDIRDEDSLASEQGLRGVHYGTYKIEITHPTRSLPAKYNTATALGYETERGNPNFTVELKAR